MEKKDLYIKTIFCCIACDGDIAKEEIDMIRDITAKQVVLSDIDIESTVNGFVESINEQGSLFLKQYLNDLHTLELSEEEQLKIIDFSLQAIRADNEIRYSEVKFFKKIIHHLSLTDEQILAIYPDIEDFLLPDINVTDDLEWSSVIFDKINFNTYKQ